MNPYPKTIVCTVFGEKCRRSVLRHACYLAKCSGARLLVANVVGDGQQDDVYPSYESATSLDTLEAAPLDDVHYEQFTVRGNPAEAIRKFSVEIEADVVVVGNDVGSEGSSTLGQLARDIVDSLPCTVVVVKDDDEPVNVGTSDLSGSCTT